MKQRGFVEEAALGLAKAVESDRAFAGVVLVVSTLLFRDIRWFIGAAFLAGGALRGTSWKLRWPLFVAAGLVLWHCEGLFRGAWPVDFLAGAWWIRVVMPLRVALLLTCAGAGMRSLTLTMFGIVGATVACMIRLEAPDWWMGALVGVSLVVLALGARGWPRAGFTVGVAAAIAVALRVNALSGWSRGTYGTAGHWMTVVLGVALACWLSLAGLAVRVSRTSETRQDTERLIVVSQRFPWPAISAVAVLLLFQDGTIPLASGGNVRYGTFERLMAASFAASLVANLGLASRASLGGLAAPLWLSMALMVSWSVAPSTWTAAPVGWTAAAVLWPLAIAHVLWRDALTLRHAGDESAFHFLLAVLAVVPGLIFYAEMNSHPPTGPHSPLRMVWLALAPIAFQAAMGATVSSRRIVLAAVGLGAISMLATAAASAARRYRGSLLPMHRDDVLTLVGVWFLAGVYIVIARRALSLTAVPLDHPSVAEARPAAPTFNQGA